MMEANEFDELVDGAAIAAAEAVLAAAERRVAAAKRDAEDADAVLDMRRLEPQGLVLLDVDGVAISVADVDDCHGRVCSAQRHATHKWTVVRHLEQRAAEARSVLVDARAAAWWPAIDYGVGRRIAAGAKADRIRVRFGQTGEEAPAAMAARAVKRDAALAEAKQDFDEGTRAIDLALRRGARMPSGVPGWLPEWAGATEMRERRHFHRPAEDEDEPDAAA